MKQGRLLLFAIAAMLLASCSSTATLTIKAPYSYRTGDTVRHANITAVGEKKVYHAEDVTLPYQMKVKYNKLPLQINVSTDSVVYKPYFVDGSDDRSRLTWASLGGSALTALWITIATTEEGVIAGLSVVEAVCCGILTCYPIYGLLTTKPTLTPTDGIIRLEKSYERMNIEELRIKNEIMGVYTLIDKKKKYKLAKADAEYLLDRAIQTRDTRHQGELNYLIGVCDYYLEDYKKAIKQFNSALTYTDCRPGVLRTNTLEFRNLAQQAYDAHIAKLNEQWAKAGAMLLAGTAAVLAASMSAPVYTPTPTMPSDYNQTQAMLMQQTLQQTNYQMMLQQQWQRNMEAAAKQSFDQYMEQAQIQFQNEYEEFCKWNRKPDGSEYSIVEYMEMRNRAWQQSQQDNYNPNTDDNGGYNPVQMHTRTKWCMVCGHSGNCPTCNGKGHYLVRGNDTTCPSCKNHDGKCTACGGTGERTVKEAY